MVPLTTAALLSHVIVGSALEQMDMERLIEEVGGAVGRRVHEGLETVDDVARELHSKLLLRNESTKQLVVESIHVSSPLDSRMKDGTDGVSIGSTERLSGSTSQCRCFH